ncbi:hypothetical protein [Rhodovulum adriaticum]|uniref:hypothetical protein n=1 Tax=Rhodovulum adriaticum TaxID=35804 RepID=UPI0010508FC6|nr:hypothetical protein [Rhodovulum adriaticum]MBK1637168.1 hypothetical protein [Rhodovulum adriaticum]
MRAAVFSISLVAALAAQQAPAQIVPEGKCAVTVASRPTLDDVRIYVQFDLPEVLRPSLDVVQTNNGWYAITVGTLPVGSFEQHKPQLVARGLLPEDAYCSAGQGYVAVVPPSDYSPGSGASAAQEPAKDHEPTTRRARFADFLEMRIPQDAIKFKIRYDAISQNGTGHDLVDLVRSYLDLLDAGPGWYLDSSLYAEGSCVRMAPALDVVVAYRIAGDVLSKTQEADFEAHVRAHEPEALAFFERWGLFDGQIMRIAYEKEKEFWGFVSKGGFCK